MADGLFDTTVFIDYYNGHAGAEALVGDVLLHRLRASYSPMSVFELWLRDMRRDEEVKYSALLALLDEAPFTSGAARAMSGWLRGAARTSRLRLAGDAVIAATAAMRNEPIYTRNPRDFARFEIEVRSC